jgi:hypothetical protein
MAVNVVAMYEKNYNANHWQGPSLSTSSSILAVMKTLSAVIWV